MMPPPKFATPRDESAPTRGLRQARFAATMLECPLMPVQQYIADVAGELLPSGLPRYKKVVVTMQRRGGKSHLAMSQIGERSFARANFLSWYTAQSGGDARDAFLKFHEDTVKGAPLEMFTRTLIGNGREVMYFPNGSAFRPFPPTEAALHGKDTDRVDIDEAWAFTEDEGRMLEQAAAPTQLTRPGGQIFIWSAGGTAESTWLANLVARGRAGDPSIAYFEWGIPDDADPDDLDIIAEHHPAFGHTITMDSLQALRNSFGDDVAGWARAAGNRWTEVIGGEISTKAWNAVRWADPIPPDAPVGYAAARAIDGSEVAIVAAADLGNVIVVEVLDVIGTHNAPEAVNAWAKDGPLAVDPIGPSAGLADAIGRNRDLVPVTASVLSAATTNLLDALDSKAIRYRQHPALDAAVKVAGTRRLGDGGKAWARTKAGSSIAALEAATLAVWAVGHRPQPAAQPKIYFPGSPAA